MSSSILSRKVDYKKDWVEVTEDTIRLANGKVVKWTSANILHDAVCAIVLDEKKNIYLVKEWRPVWDRDVIGLPAGGVDANASENELLGQMHNELMEEIGMDSRKMTKLITILSSARIRLKNHIYLATDLFESKKASDENEMIEVVKLPFKKAYERFVEDGEETTGSTIIGMMLAKERLGL